MTNEGFDAFIGDDIDGIISDNYWDDDKSGSSDSEFGIGLPTVDMQGSDNELNELDFENTWDSIEDEYPQLKWQE